MNKNSLSRLLMLIVACWCCMSAAESAEVEVAVAARSYAKVPLVLVLIEPAGNELEAIRATLANDLGFSSQFAVEARKAAPFVSKKALATFLQAEQGLVIFFSSPEEKVIEWRLYDATQGSMVAGKRYPLKGNDVAGWGHALADMIWPIISGQEGFFSTKIAFCKTKKVSDKKKIKHIYIADYDGSHPQQLIGGQSINVAPRWNNNPSFPLLFYSEYTNKNVRLMVADMRGRKRVASNFDGVNMVPSFSSDGRKAVYCASRGDGSCQIYLYGTGLFRRLTHNHANNVSPVFGASESEIYYCSDMQTGKPHIYYHNIDTNTVKQVTKGGSCSSPNYSAKKKLLAYVQRADGFMQVFIYNPATEKHQQITSDAGHKEEVSWSPCGNYLLYSVEKGGASQLVLYNLLTKKGRVITSAHEHCSYPAWSGRYHTLPSLALS